MNIWLRRFREVIVPHGLNDALIQAFLNYLADLGIFKITSSEIWELCEPSMEWGKITVLKLINQLNTLCETEKGFAVGYFIRDKKDYIPPKLPSDLLLNESKKPIFSKKSGFTTSTSDLSNLQIVKKVGRQLSPFLEMEKRYLTRLIGPNTSKEDAQMIYRYILKRTQNKSTPLPWQQLSRRRHK